MPNVDLGTRPWKVLHITQLFLYNWARKPLPAGLTTSLHLPGFCYCEHEWSYSHWNQSCLNGCPLSLTLTIPTIHSSRLGKHKSWAFGGPASWPLQKQRPRPVTLGQRQLCRVRMERAQRETYSSCPGTKCNRDPQQIQAAIQWSRTKWKEKKSCFFFKEALAFDAEE